MTLAKKIITTSFIMLMTITVFSINSGKEPSAYVYSVQIKGVNTSDSAKKVIELIDGLFLTKSTFNDATKTFEFSSAVSISNMAFEYAVSDEGYEIQNFEKKELAPMEDKKE